MIFDNFQSFTENYNGQGLYWNYFYHVWKTFSVSPFANNALFVSGTPTVTSVTVSPKTANANANGIVQLSAVVQTTDFAPKGVTWSVTSGDATVSDSGLVKLGESATGEVVVTATSVYDNTKSDTCTITVA